MVTGHFMTARHELLTDRSPAKVAGGHKSPMLSSKGCPVKINTHRVFGWIHWGLDCNKSLKGGGGMEYRPPNLQFKLDILWDTASIGLRPVSARACSGGFA